MKAMEASGPVLRHFRLTRSEDPRELPDRKIQRTTPLESTSTAVGYAMSAPSLRPPRWRIPIASRSAPS